MQSEGARRGPLAPRVPCCPGLSRMLECWDAVTANLSILKNNKTPKEGKKNLTKQHTNQPAGRLSCQAIHGRPSLRRAHRPARSPPWGAAPRTVAPERSPSPFPGRCGRPGEPGAEPGAAAGAGPAGHGGHGTHSACRRDRVSPPFYSCLIPFHFFNKQVFSSYKKPEPAIYCSRLLFLDLRPSTALYG